MALIGSPNIYAPAGAPGPSGIASTPPPVGQPLGLPRTLTAAQQQQMQANLAARAAAQAAASAPHAGQFGGGGLPTPGPGIPGIPTATSAAVRGPVPTDPTPGIPTVSDFTTAASPVGVGAPGAPA